jgi:hypothetical protein
MSFDYITRAPLEKPQRQHGPLDMENLQEICQGYFQKVSGYALELPEDIDVYMNEEGKIMGLLPNLRIEYDAVGGIERDVFVGTIVIKAANDEGGTRSMTEEELTTVETWLEDKMIWL